MADQTSHGWMYNSDVSDLKSLREILEEGEDLLLNLDGVKITGCWVNPEKSALKHVTEENLEEALDLFGGWEYQRKIPREGRIEKIQIESEKLRASYTVIDANISSKEPLNRIYNLNKPSKELLDELTESDIRLLFFTEHHYSDEVPLKLLDYLRDRGRFDEKIRKQFRR